LTGPHRQLQLGLCTGAVRAYLLPDEVSDECLGIPGVTQRSQFPDRSLISGCLAERTGQTSPPLARPTWALTHDEAATITRVRR
jgi:hypothetical protein